MAKRGYPACGSRRPGRSLILVSLVNGLLVSLVVQALMGRIDIIPTLLGMTAFCLVAVSLSLWLLHRHKDGSSRAHTNRLGGRTNS